MHQINLFLELTRLKRPIGYMLLFWPCAWGLTLAFDFNSDHGLYFFYLLLFFLGSVLMRSAGCIVNDIVDKEFDKKVSRTKNRPIASGSISIKLGLIYASTLCLLALFVLINYSNHEFLYNLYFPFFKNLIWNMELFFIPFGLFVIIGASNAVNLTDGLDGLATVPVMLVALSFTLISYVVGNTIFSEYLKIQYIPDVGELSIFCGSVVGACLGFLWYNAPPAKIFMGDTGSLSLGGSLAAIAIIVKHEIVLAIIGGLFVLETVSVIIQVISFKLTGKRIFKMAPIHHHFEKKGWAEPTIVIRFWIIAIILALVGLATLKLR